VPGIIRSAYRRSSLASRTPSEARRPTGEGVLCAVGCCFTHWHAKRRSAWMHDGPAVSEHEAMDPAGYRRRPDGQATARRLVRHCTDRSQHPAARARRTIARAVSRHRSSRDRARRRPLAIHRLAAASGGSSLRPTRQGRGGGSEATGGQARRGLDLPPNTRYKKGNRANGFLLRKPLSDPVRGSIRSGDTLYQKPETTCINFCGFIDTLGPKSEPRAIRNEPKTESGSLRKEPVC